MQELSMSMTEIWQLAVIKLLFFSFVVAGGLLFWKKAKAFWFVVVISLFSALSYAAIAWQAQRPWWGLVGDEIFVTAFLQKVAAGFFFSDFFYTNLPPFYPPLYFWIVGGIGYLFELNGVILLHVGIFLVLLATPLLVYVWVKKQFGANTSLLVTLPAAFYIVADWQAVFFKPYEFIAAVLVVLWAMFLFSDLAKQSLSRYKQIFYGISGGFLFMLFYFWFFLVIIAAAIFKLFVKVGHWHYYGKLSAVGMLSLLVALPFLGPLLLSYALLGTENWQPAWFIPEYLDLYLPFVGLSFFSLVSIVSFFFLVYFRKNIYIKALFSLLLAAYAWQGISAFTIHFWDAPFLPNKAFLFFGGAVISAIFGFGLGKVVDEKIKKNHFKILFFILAWIGLGAALPGGVFVEQSHVKQKIAELKQPVREEFLALAVELKQVSSIERLTVLSSGMPEISAFVPMNYYVSYNIHFAHPASNFSQRYYFVRNLAQAPSPEDFYRQLKQAPGAEIDALLLLKGQGFYPINFWLDNYPLGGKTEEIRIPAGLIDEQYFVKIFEDERFVFLGLRH